MAGVSILVVDDEPQILSLFSEALAQYGYTVFEALDGESAINHVRKHRIGVVFLDLKLPGVNGVETLERIREIERDVPVVVITAYPRDPLVDGAIKLGAFACLVKPFSMQDVLAILETLELQETAD